MAYDDELADRLRGALADVRGVTEKKMFGGLAFLVDGRMVVAAAGSTDGLLLRVDPERTEHLVTHDAHASRFVMRGKAMDGWLSVTVDADLDDDGLRRWVAMGVEYAATLPR